MSDERDEMRARLVATDDTYKGESAGKKWARYAFWTVVKAHFESLYRPESFVSGKHIFLASREGGDLGTLRHMGAKWESMVAIDTNQAALWQCYDKWLPTLTAEGVDGPNVGPIFQPGDAAVEVDWYVKNDGPVRSVFLDFCGHIDRGTMLTCSNVFLTLPYGALFGVAFLKGREKRQAVQSVANIGNRKRRRAVASGGRDWSRDLVWMMEGKTAWDAGAILDRINADVRCEDAKSKSVFGRWLLVSRVLEVASKYRSAKPVAIIDYHSRTTAGAGVPMVIMLFEMGKKGDLGGEPEILFMPSDPAAWIRSRAIDMEAEQAASAFNIRRETVVAWKAHATRGTYDKTG